MYCFRLITVSFPVRYIYYLRNIHWKFNGKTWHISSLATTPAHKLAHWTCTMLTWKSSRKTASWIKHNKRRVKKKDRSSAIKVFLTKFATKFHTHTRCSSNSFIVTLSLIRRTACARAQFSGGSSMTNASKTGQMAVCCQNLTLGALSSHSALSVLVGALFKKFGLFLNTPRNITRCFFYSVSERCSFITQSACIRRYILCQLTRSGKWQK
jgi:hypothetical protein